MLAQQDPISWGGAAAIMAGVGAILIASGFGVIAIANRTADGRIGPNVLMGVRTRATRSSDGAWRVAHEVARRPTIIAGWILIATAVVGAALGGLVGWGDAERAMVTWSITLGVGCVALTAFAVQGAVDGHRAAKAYEDPN